MTTRRHFLTVLGALPLSAFTFPSLACVSSQPGEDLRSTGKPRIPGEDNNDVMDEALELLVPYGPSFRGGLSNHGPMTAEALVSLGRSDAVIPWVERYRRRLAPRASTQQKIDQVDWREALGKRSRLADWEARFTEELAEDSWETVLGRWVPRLAPGMAAAGLHCVIRLGHATCSLTAKQSALRLDELARALAYWAAEFLALPGEHKKNGVLAPSQAVVKVRRLPRSARRSRGLITTELKDLVGFEAFLTAIDLVGPTAGSPSFLADLQGTVAGLLLNTNSNSFEFLHAVTGTEAVAELLPHVSDSARGPVKMYLWQAIAGIIARYSPPALSAEWPSQPEAVAQARLVKHAVLSGDEHTIKLTAACLRAAQRNSDPRHHACAAQRLGLE